MQASQQATLRIGGFGQSGTTPRVGFAHGRQLVDPHWFAEAVAARDQFMHGRRLEFVEAMHVEVLAAAQHRQFAVFGRHLQPLAEGDDRGDAALLVHHVLRQFVDGGQRLAEVMAQRREADHVVTGRQGRSHVADQLDVHAGIDFRMVFGALRHAVQRIHLRQHCAQGVRVAQGAQEGGRRVAAQCLRKFLPHAFGGEFGQFAVFGHRTHQRQRFRRDGEAQRGEARHEPCRAQYPQRILDEGVADVAQHAPLDVGGATERIDQAAIGSARDRVDGEVAPAQVLLQRHRGIGVDHEAGMPARGLALGAGQCVFLAAVRVQEHREVAADLAVAGGQHVLHRGADHHVVVVAGGKPEQGIAHGAADQVDAHVVGEWRCHGAMMPEGRGGTTGGAGVARVCWVFAGGAERRCVRKKVPGTIIAMLCLASLCRKPCSIGVCSIGVRFT